MMFGFACRETEELMPSPIAMAHRSPSASPTSARRASFRTCGPTARRRSRIAYDGDTPVRVDTVLISAQHREEVDVETLLKPDIERR
jgi:S-adenosylmethionine synthetase